MSPPGGGEALPGMTEIVFRALSTLKVLSACRFPTLINSVNSLWGAVWWLSTYNRRRKNTTKSESADLNGQPSSKCSF